MIIPKELSDHFLNPKFWKIVKDRSFKSLIKSMDFVAISSMIWEMFTKILKIVYENSTEAFQNMLLKHLTVPKKDDYVIDMTYLSLQIMWKCATARRAENHSHQIRIISIHEDHINVIHTCNQSNMAYRCLWLLASSAYHWFKWQQSRRRIHCDELQFFGLASHH